MATTFQKLRTTKLGEAGEALIEKHFTAKGWTIYRPKKGRRHPLDMIGIDQSGQVVLIEVKTYPRRWAYSDTGIDARDWRSYLEIHRKNPNPILLVFIDIYEKRVYYFQINEALIGAAYEADGKVYFPLAMAKPLIQEIGEKSLATLQTAAQDKRKGYSRLRQRV